MNIFKHMDDAIQPITVYYTLFRYNNLEFTEISGHLILQLFCWSLKTMISASCVANPAILEEAVSETKKKIEKSRQQREGGKVSFLSELQGRWT